MKHAQVHGQLVPATPDAPAMATCPKCGGVVKLRSRQGTWFWRHVHLPRGGCVPSGEQLVAKGTVPVSLLSPGEVMNERSDELIALEDYVESAIDEINNAVVAANDLGYDEIALWLEWLGEELNDLLSNVLRILSTSAEDVEE